MKKTLVFLAIICLYSSNFVFAVAILNDGESYTFGSEAGNDIYLGTGEDFSGGVYLDRWNPSSPGTNLNLKDGAVIAGIWANHTSTINMSGGVVSQSVQMGDNCQFIATGGEVNSFSVSNNSSLNISNTKIDIIGARYNSSVTVNNSSTINQINVRNNSSLVVNGGILGEWGIWGIDDSSITMRGGSTGHYAIYGNSTGVLDGGIIRQAIKAGGSSSLTMNNGIVQDYTTQDNGFGVIQGGVIEGVISAFDESHIDIKEGGTGNLFRVFDDGKINLYGSNFCINGEPIDYGKGIFEVFGETLDSVASRYEGRITGILLDGTSFDNDFYIYNMGNYEGNADIYIVPEPASLVLFGLGFVTLRKRKA